MINSLQSKSIRSFREGAFFISLVISLSAIVCDIVSVYCIRNAAALPLNLNLFVNSLFFLLTPLMINVIIYNALLLMYEDRADTRGLHLVVLVQSVLFALVAGAVAVNLKNGCLFRFDEAFNYVRGPINPICYYYYVASLILVLVAFLPERNRVKRAFRSAIILLPILTIAVSSMQVLFPDTLLTGTSAALSLTVLYICGQQQHLHTDHLTDLANREMFYHTVECFAKRERRFHVVMVSIRDYKTINNRYGQRTGDAFLKAVSEYLQTLPKSVVACRFSGVEFALVMNMSEVDYEQLFQTLYERFKQPWEANAHEIVLRAALADVAYPENASSINELIASLEYAVRTAKAGEQDIPVRFDKQLRNLVGRRNYVINLLEPAYVEDRFYLNYQPIIHAKTGLPVGAEVLLRLREENGRLVSPAEFIPLAEECGVVSKLSWRAMEKACRFLSEHPACGVGWLTVNVAGQQYGQSTSLEHVEALLREYRLRPEQIKLEITERVLVEDIERSRRTIEELRRRGVGIYLDDFGTGYSNLANVIQLPLECVKIDKSFIDPVTADPHARGLLRTVVHGLHALGVTVLAEGVETAEQDQIVSGFGVDLIQGFYYARPMDEDVFLAYLREHASPASPAE